MTIRLVNPANGKELHQEADGLYGEGVSFPLINGAFRIVNAGGDNYTDNFGFQWNKFDTTQIDGDQSSQSKDRFLKTTQWHLQNLSGKNILEVGSGAGRFSQVVLAHTEAELYSVDYSNAVEANFKNNGKNKKLHLFQASIYELPFAPGQFDKVFCFGVLQHTPDFKKSVKCLIDMAKPGGEVIVDFYPITGWWTKVNAKYMLRPFTKNMEHKKLHNLIERNVNWMIPVSKFLQKVKLGALNRFLPICDIHSTLPASLNKEELREWAILDTFDMFSPEYDNPQRLSTVEKWFKEFGMKEVKAEFVSYGDNFSVAIVRGIK